MNNIEEYKGQQLVQNVNGFEASDGIGNGQSPDLIAPIRRHWRILVFTFLLVCAIGIPAVWFFVKPVYRATAAIRIAPFISSILFAGDEGVPMYKNFMYTQSDLITGDKVLQRVADDLMDKELNFFKEVDDVHTKVKRKLLGQYQSNDPVMLLRKAVAGNKLTVGPEANTELIKISMTGPSSSEAAQIVDAFVRAYMSNVVSQEDKDGNHKLLVLENERKVLIYKLGEQRKNIRAMSEEYGTSALTGRQEMMLNRVAALQEELTKFEMRKITLKVQIEMLKNTKTQSLKPEELLEMRHEFVNADLMVKALTANIVQMEQSLIIAKQTLAPTNPRLKHKTELLTTMQQRLSQRGKEVNKNFDKMIAESAISSGKLKLTHAKVELEQITAYEKRIEELLKAEDADTIELGRKQLAIQDLQDQLNMAKELYETVRRRIQELEMERKRPARIEVAYYANTFPAQSKRLKYIVALIFAAAALGIILAILRGRIDLNLYTPEDVVKTVGVRIIGTTTSADSVKKALLPQQIASDYQTICANLGLFDGEGIPKKLIITSPGPEEGKTTLAINLATSITKTGKKVLLIDGDLRKPEIRRLLNLPKDYRRLKDILSGRELGSIVCSTSVGFDVLATDYKNMPNIPEFLSKLHKKEFLNIVGQRYDHVIVDTPPTLCVPDSMLWAKMAGAAILTSFSGHTESSDLRETFERLSQINVKILGTVLNNVSANYSYYPYGYGYYTNVARKKSSKNTKKTILLSTQK